MKRQKSIKKRCSTFVLTCFTPKTVLKIEAKTRMFNFFNESDGPELKTEDRIREYENE